MANLAITISNTLPLMAMSPAVYWGALTWGTDNWGRDEDLVVGPNKQIANTLSFATANTFDVEHLVSLGTMVLSDAISVNFVKSPITNTMVFTEALSEISRGDGLWDDIFVKPTSEGLEKIYDVFERVTDGSDGFTQVPDGTTEWS
jgi:hypothetical protein